MKRYSIIFTVIGFFVALASMNLYDIQKSFIAKFKKQTKLVLDNEINLKKNSTLALAIATSEHKDIEPYFLKHKVPYLEKISKNLRRYTNYKNIHFAIVDTNATILYATYKIIHYNTCKKFSQKKNSYKTDIVLDCRGIHFGAFVPIFIEGKLQGYLETFSQFNSIVKDLQRIGIEAVVLLDKKYKSYAKELHRMVREYKVVNSNTSPQLLEQIQNIDIEQVLYSNEPLAINGQIFYRYPLKDLEGEILGWIVFSKEKNAVLTDFISKSLIYRVIFMIVLFIFTILIIMKIFNREMVEKLRKQYEYFATILDKIQEIVIINDGFTMKYANSTFFQYFNDYKNLEEFLREHQCICDFFVHEEGFIDAIIEGKKWTEYILAHPDKEYYAKVRYKEQEYIFQVKASRLNEEDFVVIFIDITQKYQKQKRLQQLAIIDPLTKLYNRYFFEKVANEGIKKAATLQTDLLFAMIDIDYFKQINDTYGHDVGDVVLREIAAILQHEFRKSDLIFRIGGEEFLIIFETTNVQKVLELLEDVRRKIATHKFEGVYGQVTISIGVAKYRDGDDVHSLYKRADEALYEAKKLGRNRLVYKGDEDD
ncbi:diguanylate cyclase [Nitratiruptor sp. YY09-18]|uniref:sensor domain-containing diguanylate cyclase n=1 Tax=Nitratiruptor sp. YY09-18 TaxID=2724901 RepID=UPI001916C630|nr:diguanylate cyclase [Nitratiruptor sp. YY09-18]BCD68725.1 diguanylate cyclase [Nitratiruptor sp. YY09-18]